jgi:transposase
VGYPPQESALYHHGVPPRRGLDLLTAAGREWLERAPFPAAAREQVTIGLLMIDALDAQVPPIDRELRAYARRQTGCRGLMRHYGIGELTSVVILAELGDAQPTRTNRGTKGARCPMAAPEKLNTRSGNR